MAMLHVFDDMYDYLASTVSYRVVGVCLLSVPVTHGAGVLYAGRAAVARAAAGGVGSGKRRPYSQRHVLLAAMSYVSGGQQRLARARLPGSIQRTAAGHRQHLAAGCRARGAERHALHAADMVPHACSACPCTHTHTHSMRTPLPPCHCHGPPLPPLACPPRTPLHPRVRAWRPHSCCGALLRCSSCPSRWTRHQLCATRWPKRCPRSLARMWTWCLAPPLPWRLWGSCSCSRRCWWPARSSRPPAPAAAQTSRCAWRGVRGLRGAELVCVAAGLAKCRRRYAGPGRCGASHVGLSLPGGVHPPSCMRPA